MTDPITIRMTAEDLEEIIACIYATEQEFSCSTEESQTYSDLVARLHEGTIAP